MAIQSKAKLQQSILFVGPMIPPMTGQAVAFTKAYNGVQTNEKYLVNHNLENCNVVLKLARTVVNVIKGMYILIYKRVDVLYFTCSRSFLGSIKDVILITTARAMDVRVVNHLHGSDFKDFYNATSKWYKKVLRFAYAHVKDSIVLTESMKEQFDMFEEMNVHVVRNFYDRELECESSCGNDDGIIRILFLSNILATKGIFELLDAFEKLQGQYNIELRVAGSFMSDSLMSDTTVRERFNQRIHEIPNAIHVGAVSGEEKKKLLCTSDIFVLPSYFVSEAVPISVLEAMATGNVVVVSDHKYLPQIIPKGNCIVTKKSVESLVRGLTHIIRNKKRLAEVKKENILYSRRNHLEDIYVANIQSILFGSDIR
tara:strand:- start:11571 stop:12680 length:1110 start_codon:yes stop_codon:yes gene_type:complete